MIPITNVVITTWKRMWWEPGADMSSQEEEKSLIKAQGPRKEAGKGTGGNQEHYAYVLTVSGHRPRLARVSNVYV